MYYGKDPLLQRRDLQETHHRTKPSRAPSVYRKTQCEFQEKQKDYRPPDTNRRIFTRCTGKQPETRKARVKKSKVECVTVTDESSEEGKPDSDADYREWMGTGLGADKETVNEVGKDSRKKETGHDQDGDNKNTDDVLSGNSTEPGKNDLDVKIPTTPLRQTKSIHVQNVRGLYHDLQSPPKNRPARTQSDIFPDTPSRTMSLRRAAADVFKAEIRMAQVHGPGQSTIVVSLGFHKLVGYQ